jgi:hydroxypyruvate reductase
VDALSGSSGDAKRGREGSGTGPGRGRRSARGGRLGLDPAVFLVKFLADKNSTEFLGKLGDLVAPGPTFTDVNDLRGTLVDSV